MSDVEAPVDAAQVWADGALLDAIGGWELNAVPGLAFVEQWRRNLDAAPVPALDMDLVASQVAAQSGTFPGGIRRTTAALTALAILTGGSVAAAAASGPTGPLGPLHRALFGAAHRGDPRTATIEALLNAAARDIDAARDAGGITPTGRQRIGTLLASAEALLAVDHDAPSSLHRRHDQLRRALTHLPSLVQSSAASKSTPSLTGTPRPEPVAPQRGTPTTPSGPAAQGPARRPSTGPGGAARSLAVTPVAPRSDSTSGTEDRPSPDGSADTTGNDGGPTAGRTITSGSDSGAQDDSGSGSGGGTRSGRRAAGPTGASASGDSPDS